MKKIILTMLILVLSMSLFFSVSIVNAEPAIGEYVQIKETTSFSSTTDDAVNTITLPAGYWVEIVSKGASLTKVKYNGTMLYLANDVVNSLVKYTPTTTYPKPQHISHSHDPIHIFLDYENTGKSKEYLYRTKECAMGDTTYEVTSETIELGLLNVLEHNGKIVYLVSTPSGEVGYIKAMFTDMPTGTTITPYPGQDEEPTAPEISPKPNKDSSKLPAKNNVVKVVLIISICVLSAILVFLLFKPTRKKRSGRYSVDSDDDYDRDDSYQDRY